MNDEKQIAETIIKLGQDKAEVETRLASEYGNLAVAVQEREDARLTAARTALEEAQQAYEEKSSLAAAAKEAVVALRARWQAGDESVTTEQVRTAELEAERTAAFAAAKKKSLEAAQQVYDLEASDNLLPKRAIEVFAKHTPTLGLTDCHFTYSKDPNYIPPLEPAIVFSQTTPTGRIDRATKNGTVSYKVFGDVVLEVEKVIEAFADEGCEVSVDDATISFHEATWDIPILREPSVEKLREWAREAAILWKRGVDELGAGMKAHIEGASASVRAVTYDEASPGTGTLTAVMECSYNGRPYRENALRVMQAIAAPLIGESGDIGLVGGVDVSMEYRAGKPSGVQMGGALFSRDLTRDHEPENNFTFTITLDVSYTPLEDVK